MNAVERSAFREGTRHAFALPCLVLAAGYTGLGALAAGNGLSLTGTLLSTLCIWALPGQLILVEMHTLGAPFFAVVLTVALSGARFLPMTVVFMPLLREAGRRPLLFYVVAHFVTITGWAWAMARFPAMPAERRLAYYFGFALSLMFAATLATAAGFLGGDLLPPLARLAMVFMSPMYFLLILSGSTGDWLGRAAVLCGVILGPPAHLLAPQWSVLVAGFAGGSLAFVLHRARERRARMKVAQ